MTLKRYMFVVLTTSLLASNMLMGMKEEKNTTTTDIKQSMNKLETKKPNVFKLTTDELNTLLAQNGETLVTRDGDIAIIPMLFTVKVDEKTGNIEVLESQKLDKADITYVKESLRDLPTTIPESFKLCIDSSFRLGYNIIRFGIIAIKGTYNRMCVIVPPAINASSRAVNYLFETIKSYCGNQQSEQELLEQELLEQEMKNNKN